MKTVLTSMWSLVREGTVAAVTVSALVAAPMANAMEVQTSAGTETSLLETLKAREPGPLAIAALATEAAIEASADFVVGVAETAISGIKSAARWTWGKIVTGAKFSWRVTKAGGWFLVGIPAGVAVALTVPFILAHDSFVDSAPKTVASSSNGNNARRDANTTAVALSSTPTHANAAQGTGLER